LYLGHSGCNKSSKDTVQILVQELLISTWSVAEQQINNSSDR
jgi:hypothetical protein